VVSGYLGQRKLLIACFFASFRDSMK